MRVAIVLAVAVSTVVPLATVRGATFVVSPGPGTPVQDAIDAASPGDTIRLMLGSYPEQLVIDKRISLVGVRSASPNPSDTTSVGTGQCIGSDPAIWILANGVRLRRVEVVGGDGGGIRAIGSLLNLTDVFVRSPCEVVNAPFVNVESSNRVTLSKVWARGTATEHAPAGIRIADTVQDGRVRIRKASASGNDIGILLENDAARSVLVASGDVNFNSRGIVLRGTTGVSVDRNSLIGNSTSGIEIEATSSGNLVTRNAVSGSTNDVVDYGSANCWRRNTFTTGSVSPCP